MSKVDGVRLGKVIKVDDKGQVQVEYPIQTGLNKSTMAPVATLMAGDDRGSWFMPEDGDDALVAFLEGEDTDPYVVGFLWHGRTSPPDTSRDKRVIRSKTGHTILLDDSSGAKLQVSSADGLKVVLDDASSRIEIEAADGLKVVLDDGNSRIEIEGGGRRIVMEQGKIEFS